MRDRERLEDAGRWLRDQRERRGLSVREFASKLDVSTPVVYDWQNGKMGVSDERAAQIADVLDMPEIDVRRGLRLWVPDDERHPAAVDDEHAALIARQRRAIWDGLADDPEERDRLLADFDRELERAAETYSSRMQRYREWRKRTAS